MEKRDVLKICMDNGFFLDKGILDFFINMDSDEVLQIIKNLKKIGVKDKILNLEIFEKYKDEIVFDSVEISSGENINILNKISFNSGKIEIEDFVSYFRDRFEKIRDILIRRGDLDNLTSIRRIGYDNGFFSIIGMVYDKKITKNKNLLIEIEDLTGKSVILVNRENKQLFEQAKQLLLDDILAFKCTGSSKMLFATDFIYPDCCLNKENFGNKDEYVAFISDLHIGSKYFLEDNMIRFINWLNGEFGDFRQKEIASKVKYLFLVGDNIEGVGIYPGQEDYLLIKGCKGQYEKLAKILGMIRKDIEIIMIPGSHDAVFVGEPMNIVDKKWVEKLTSLKNFKMITNPSFLETGGLRIMFYSGGSLNGFIDNIPNIRLEYGHNYPVLVLNEILKRRHLAPIYGEMDIIPNKLGDELILTEIPDVFVVGGQHKAQVGNYNNILTISTSCFQKKTDFEEKVGNDPDPCKVPILNLKNKEVKILDFSDNVDEIIWNDSDDLICNLGELEK